MGTVWRNWSLGGARASSMPETTKVERFLSFSIRFEKSCKIFLLDHSHIEFKMLSYCEGLTVIWGFQVVFKDSMSSSVAGVTEGDYRCDLSWMTSISEKLINYIGLVCKCNGEWISVKVSWSNVNRPVLQDGWKDGADNLLNGWREWVWSHPAHSLTTYQSILDRLLIMWQLGYIERSYRQSEATCRPPRTRRPTWWNSTWSKRLSESSLLGNRSTRLLSIEVSNSMCTQ